MARKGENLYKRRDGRWEGRFACGRTGSGKTKYSSVYGKTYMEAKRKLREAKSRSSGKLLAVSEADKRTLRDLGEEWIQYMQPQVKESTLVKYEHILRAHLIPELGKYAAWQITPRIAEGFADKLRKTGGKEGKGLSSKTVSDSISVLKSLLHFIEKRYSCHCCSIEPMRVGAEQGEMRVLTYEEQRQLTEYLWDSQERRDMGILLALYTGLRIGELCALKEKNICIETKTLSVRATAQRIQENRTASGQRTKILIDTPKSVCSVRDIPMPDGLVSRLQNWTRPSEHYFLSGSESVVVEPRNLQYHFKKVLRETGLADANFHALRHTFATRCVEQGFDIKSLSEILGHSTVNITLNRYVHPSMKMKRANMEKLAELLTVK